MKIFICILVWLSVSLVVSADELKREELKFGVFPYVSAHQIIRNYSSMKYYFEKEVGVSTLILSAKNFADFVAKTENREFDVIFTAPHFALRAEREGSYERLVRIEGMMAAQLVVPESGRIKTLEDLKDVTVFMPDPLAIISVLGKSELSKNTLTEAKDFSFRSIQSHRNILMSIMQKEQTVGFASSIMVESFNKKKKRKLRVLQSSEHIPTAMFMMNAKLSGEMKQRLMTAMEEMKDTPYGNDFFSGMPFSGFQKISDNDMRLLAPYADRLELML